MRCRVAASVSPPLRELEASWHPVRMKPARLFPNPRTVCDSAGMLLPPDRANREHLGSTLHAPVKYQQAQVVQRQLRWWTSSSARF